MSRFFSGKYQELVPYVPGEQPRDRTYIKLNTNESPFPPSPLTGQAAKEAGERLHLYSDPECLSLREKMSEVFGIAPQNMMMVNGSDEALDLAFMAFADEACPLAFADITYGFYAVLAGLYNIPYTEIPLREDFSIDVSDYRNIGKMIVIANPNAPTGLYLPLGEIEKIVQSNPEQVVLVDEAYIDFGGESARTLIGKYENLLVVGTFSKSRSMAGARLGFIFGSEALIADLNTLRCSRSPYNVNRMTAAVGIAALSDNAYYMKNCDVIRQNRVWTARQLAALGFHLTESLANFVFAESDRIDGGVLYEKLRERGILVRHFTTPRIRNYNRITIGTMEQMQSLICAVREILAETENGDDWGCER